MAIDKNFLAELRMRLPLSSIIGQRIKITRAGREFKACCPFHEEKSPSFYVNDDKGFFHCFGCGAHGDIVGFRMRYDNVTFREAVEALARDAGLQVPADQAVNHEQIDTNRKLQKVMELATLWFEQQLRLPSNRFAMDYLLNRGLKPETISAFRLGFAPNNWDGLREALLAQGVEVNQLVELGLLKQSEKPDKPPYSFFRGRIMFPVSDRQGLTIAFGGRHLEEAFSTSEINSRTDYKPPKYINSSEHSLFHKGSQLYSLSRARANLKDQPLIIVEGYMDVIALHQAGFTAAVAPLGTALTEQQIQLAWHVTQASGQTPILCFDGDNAGVNAAYRALDRMLPFVSPNQQIRFAFLPKGEDPDSLVKQYGRDAFQNILNQARTVFDVLWQRSHAIHGTATPEDQAKLQSQIEHDIRLIGDKTLQGVYFRELKDRLYGLRRNSFKPQAGGGNRAMGPAVHQVNIAPLRNDRTNLQIKILYAAAINHPYVLKHFHTELGQIPAIDGADEAAFHDLQDSLLHWEAPNAPQSEAETQQSLVEYLSNQGFDTIVKNLLTNQIYKYASFARPASEPTDVIEGWQHIWNAIQTDLVQRDIQELKRLARNSEEDVERLWELRQQQLQQGDEP